MYTKVSRQITSQKCYSELVFKIGLSFGSSNGSSHRYCIWWASRMRQRGCKMRFAWLCPSPYRIHVWNTHLCMHLGRWCRWCMTRQLLVNNYFQPTSDEFLPCSFFACKMSGLRSSTLVLHISWPQLSYQRGRRGFEFYAGMTWCMGE